MHANRIRQYISLSLVLISSVALIFTFSPWIGCIQEHRNIYSLISNDFYQKDYVDPLEDAVLESNRQQFSKSDAEIGENDGYVLKFDGVEVDLGNWREHVEADAEIGRAHV